LKYQAYKFGSIEVYEVFIMKINGLYLLTIKRLWNTVILDGSIPQGEVERMIDNSFMLVVSKMTKKDQKAIHVHI